MNCPFCNEEIGEKAFFNISLASNCPKCKKQLVFNPKPLPLVLLLMLSYTVWTFIPDISPQLFDFLLGFVVMMLLGLLIIRIMLRLGMGKISEYGAIKKR